MHNLLRHQKKCISTLLQQCQRNLIFANDKCDPLITRWSQSQNIFSEPIDTVTTKEKNQKIMDIEGRMSIEKMFLIFSCKVVSSTSFLQVSSKIDQHFLSLTNILLEAMNMHYVFQGLQTHWKRKEGDRKKRKMTPNKNTTKTGPVQSEEKSGRVQIKALRKFKIFSWDFSQLFEDSQCIGPICRLY